MTTRMLAVVIGLSALTTVAQAGDDGGIELLPGQDLSAWRQPAGDWTIAGAVALDPQDAQRLTWKAGTGVAVNGPQGRTVDLISTQEFGDVEVHVEFLIPDHSNSGVYFMGRYEVQIYDSFGVEKDKYPGIECGGIYPRWNDKAQHEYEGHSPRVNASKRPGEWQTFDIVFRAPRFAADGKKIANAKFVKVVHNGQVVHENVEVTGPTRGGFEDEQPRGPIRLQGDHGPVAYRNLVLKPLRLKAAGTTSDDK